MTGPQRRVVQGSLLPAREKDWQRTLVEGFEKFGWSVQHVFPLQTKYGWRTGTTASGWPDLVCLRGPWIVGCEVKGVKTLVEAQQIEWLERFALIPSGRGWILRPTDDWQAIVSWIARPKDAPQRYGWGEYARPVHV